MPKKLLISLLISCLGAYLSLTAGACSGPRRGAEESLTPEQAIELCSLCDDNGMAECSSCGGTGGFPCRHCDSEGVQVDGKKCIQCLGKGGYPCVALDCFAGQARCRHGD